MDRISMGGLVGTMKRRFFAFGCSFTRYNWPTWADIVAHNYDEFQNWGHSGGGNTFIFNSIVEAHLKNEIKPHDVVGVMWTNICREDRYVNNKWLTPGNIFTQKHYPYDWVQKFSDLRGYYIRDLNIIAATEAFLKTIGCRYFFLSMVPILNSAQYDHTDDSELIQDILPYHALTLHNIRPSVYETVFNFDWWSRPFQFKNHQVDAKLLETPATDYETRTKIRKDPHPTPAEHLEYLDAVIPEEYVDPSTREWTAQMDSMLRNFEDYTSIWKPQQVERW